MIYNTPNSPTLRQPVPAERHWSIPSALYLAISLCNAHSIAIWQPPFGTVSAVAYEWRRWFIGSREARRKEVREELREEFP